MATINSTSQLINRFEQTSIWQKTLAKQIDPDIHEKQREFLRVQFENFREKANLLASEISIILPEFTVHDISHIDALWETAELVTKEEVELNPAEAFVLGGAFLIHDLGMGLASFPSGINELKKEAIWKDTVASVLKTKLKREINEIDFINLDKDTERIAIENVLRLLHAKNAEKLALISWKNKEGQDLFLIENSYLRESYGSIIGLIAHSHGWSIEELANKELNILGSPGKFPSSWTIDPVKLACILRIADATQIDDRRAPSFLRAIRKPSGFSDKHWNFQQKLNQPRLESNRLVYTSKSAFTLKEVDSWWVCHDTLQMIDHELKEVDSLLAETNRKRLRAIGIASIEDPKRLSKQIKVEGWQPVDTKIRITNVARLVSTLGGEQLYGDNSIVPLRELIQNASDAIRARRILENKQENFGNIIVRFGKETQGQYIEVEDNGIGMSPKVLTGPFLDFGQSFWGTSLMHEELPGLESKGFLPTGKYGIGFFSVFMIGEKVTVASKRYQDGWDSTLILEFNQGVSSRPILRKAESSEIIKEGGTRIRVWLSNNRILEKLLEKERGGNNKITTTELIETLCPSMDCNISLEENGNLKSIIKANDWRTITPISLIKRLIGASYYNELTKAQKQVITEISKNMNIIEDSDGKIVGRAFLYKEEYKQKEIFSLNGLVTVGGLRSSELSGIIGILIGTSDRASRDIGVPIINHEKLSEWSTSQANLLSKLNLNEEIQIDCSSLIRLCGGNTSNLKIAFHKSGAITYQQFKDIISENKYKIYFVIHDAAVSNYERENNCKIDFIENAFWVMKGSPVILQTRNMYHYIPWPTIEKKTKEYWFGNETLDGLITEALSTVWNCSTDEIIESSEISSDEKEYEAIVGSVAGQPVVFDHIDIMKKPKRK